MKVSATHAFAFDAFFFYVVVAKTTFTVYYHGNICAFCIFNRSVFAV